MQPITSRDNARVKRLVSLHKRENARREGLVFLEGERLCTDAFGSGIKPSEVVITEKNIPWAEKYAGGAEVTLLSDNCFKKIASTVNPQGIACIVKQPVLENEIDRSAVPRPVTRLMRRPCVLQWALSGICR